MMWHVQVREVKKCGTTAGTLYAAISFTCIYATAAVRAMVVTSRYTLGGMGNIVMHGLTPPIYSNVLALYKVKAEDFIKKSKKRPHFGLVRSF